MTPHATLVQRIISGGQTGVDRAALDVAIALGIPCGGWCPKGRMAEDGVIPAHYPLRETETADYAERTVRNVTDSSGTLILTWAPPSEGTAFTIEAAKSLGKPHFVVDLREDNGTDDAAEWLLRNRIRTLNVAGPRASKHPRLYAMAADFLTRLFEEEPAETGEL